MVNIRHKIWLQVEVGSEIIMHLLLFTVKPLLMPIEANSGSVY